MEDSKHKIVKVGDDVIAFPGDMEDAHVAKLISSFRDKKKNLEQPVTEQSEHARQLSPAKPLSTAIPAVPEWAKTPLPVYAEKINEKFNRMLGLPAVDPITQQQRKAVAAFDKSYPITGGIMQGVSNFGQGMLTPANIALMLTAPQSKLLSAYFAVQAAKGSYQSAKAAEKAFKEGKNKEAAQYATESLLGLGVAGVAGAHAVKGTAVDPSALQEPTGPKTIEGEGKPTPYIPPFLKPSGGAGIVPVDVRRSAQGTASPLALPEIKAQAESLRTAVPRPVSGQVLPPEKTSLPAAAIGKSDILRAMADKLGVPVVDASKTTTIEGQTRPINVKANFPPAKEENQKWKNASQNAAIAGQFTRLGIPGFAIEAPYKFGLSEQGNIDPYTGDIQISAASSDPEHTLAHELAHDIYNRLSPENKAMVEGYVKNSEAYRNHAGGLEERIADHFADVLLGRDQAPVSIKKAFLESPVTTRTVTKKLPTGTEEQEPPRPAYERSWEEVARYGGGNLRKGDDIESIVKTSGDFPLVVKDITGARHIAPASIVAEVLKNPVADGYVDSVFMAKDHLAEDSNSKLANEIETYKAMVGARRFLGRSGKIPDGPPMSDAQVAEWADKLKTLEAEAKLRASEGYKYSPRPKVGPDYFHITQGGSRPLIRALETAKNAQRLGSSTRPALAPSPAEGSAPQQVEMNPADIIVSPDYQFKPNADKETGLVDPLTGEYDPERAGKIVVWKNPNDGETYVVQGFHRLDLAKRSGIKSVPVEHLPQEDVPDLLGRLKIREIEKKASELKPTTAYQAIDPRKETLGDASENLSKFLFNVGKRLAMESKGQEILDNMEESGEQPREVSDSFWESTYPKLPPEIQRRFERYAKSISGFEPGTVVAIGPNGEKIVANDWKEVGKALDLPHKAEYLEGPERGLVVYMKEAQRRFPPTPALQEPLDDIKQKAYQLQKQF